MRARALLAGFGLVFGTSPIVAQLPQAPQFPGTPVMPPASAIPSTSSNPGMQPQPIVPVSTQNPAPFPVLPGSGYPGNFPTTPPNFPLPPGAAPQQFNPTNFTPLIPNGPSPGSTQQNPVALAQQMGLPKPENKFSINVNDLNLKRISSGWQLWHGARLLRDFGASEANARDALRVYRDLRPTEWAIIGTGKPIVEYGLLNGRTPLAAPVQSPEEARNGVPVVPTGDNNRPIVTGAGARMILPIDFHTVRVEAVRGVWCLRDDYNILINFGADKGNAEQALGVVRKYGFNRLGIVGEPASPAMSYFFAVSEAVAAAPAKSAIVQIGLQSQIENMARVGIPVAGVGYVGEMVRFDPNKVDVRKEGSEWVVVGGSEVLGRFGPTEWIARDAARTIQDARFTEFCKVGSAGLTFFLVDGRSPTRVPFNAKGREFDLNSLKVSKSGDRFVITENNRYLFDCASPEEGETLIRVLKYYQFDQLCHLGPSPRLGVSFLAKTR